MTSRIREWLHQSLRPGKFPTAFVVSWQEAVIPVVLFVVSLIWLGNPGYYLFGQDSYSFILPFGYQDSPFIAAHYNAQSLFTYTLVDWLTEATGSAFLAERIILATFVALSSFGIVHLLRIVNVVRGKPAQTGVIFKGLAAAIYVMNPYSLSVEWQHVQGWTFFPVILPFVLAFLLETHYVGLNLRRLVFTTLVGLLVAPGLAGAYAFVVAYAFSFFAAVEALSWIFRKITVRKAIGRVVAYMVLLLLLTVWNTVQYFGSPLTPSESPSALVALFVSESSTTTITNVLTLTAYSPIQYVPSYFPWIQFLPWLVIAGILLLGAILLTSGRVIHDRTVVLLTLLVGPVVLVMTGSNPPFGAINQLLLSLGGPFEILVNPYYFLAPYYCLYLSYMAYLVLDRYWPRSLGIASPEASVADSRARIELSNVPDGNLSVRSNLAEPEAITVQNTNLTVSARRKLHLPDRASMSAILAIGLVFASTSIYAVPFLSAQVYQPNGFYINEEIVPPDYYALSSFLSENYSGPIYNVMLLPSSSGGAAYLTYNGGNDTFPDSEGLLQNFIPYPTIWKYPQGTLLTAESPAFGAIENATALISQEGGNLLAVLDAVHVRYVIVETDYYSNRDMLQAPNGVPYNIPALEENLNISLGPPASIGSFLVYTNPYATPVASATSFPDTVTTPTLNDYFDFLADLSPSDQTPLTAAIDNSLWDSSTGGTKGFVVTRYSGGNQTVSIPAGDVPLFMNSTGSLVPSLNGTSVQGQTVYVHPFVIVRGNLSPVFSGSMAYNASCNCYSTPPSLPNSILAMNSDQFGWPTFRAALKVNLTTPFAANLMTLQFLIGHEMTLSIVLQRHSPSEFLLAATANLTSESNFGWNNTEFLPASAFAGIIQLNASVTDSMFTVGVQNSSGSTVVDSIYFAPNELELNGGYNVGEFTPSKVFDPSRLGYTLAISFSGSDMLGNASLVEQPLLRYVVSTPAVSSYTPLSYAVSATGSGDYQLTVNALNSSVAYLGLCTISPGDWQVTGAGIRSVGTSVSGPFYSYVVALNHDMNGITVLFHLQNYVGISIALGIIEFSATAGLSILLIVAAWYHPNRKSPRYSNSPEATVRK
jgi:hypothetical protein